MSYGILIHSCYGIIQFGNLDGAKRHDDGQARYEPRSLAFSSHTSPPHHRRYLPAHAIRFIHIGCISNEFPKLHNKASWRLLLHFAIICTLLGLMANNSYAFTESAIFCQHASLALLGATNCIAPCRYLLFKLLVWVRNHYLLFLSDIHSPCSLRQIHCVKVNDVGLRPFYVNAHWN